jgi:hypothetical protein
MRDQQSRLAGALSLEGWVAIAAVAFILLIVLATLPGIPW